MSKIKITVIKVFGPEDVLGHEYIRPSGRSITKCSFKEGESFIVDEGGNMPEGFCHHAWFALYTNVSILRYGGGFPDWTVPGTIYTTCPDGLRPVSFKLERLES